MINDKKENRCDTGTQKFAQPINPEIRAVGQPQHSNGNGDCGVESAPGNLSDGYGLSEYGETNCESIKRIPRSGRGTCPGQKVLHQNGRLPNLKHTVLEI